MHERLRLRRPHGVMPSCNLSARLWVLMDAAEDAGVEMLLNSGAFDTIVEDGVVRGVAVATPTGPVAVLGKAVIDATGDGDVAAFAGAECVLGSEREHLVMYALMPEGDRPGRFLNVKTSMLDVTDVEDVTRMVLAERRRHRGSPHDHGIYLAPRESRHVRGGVILTLTDQLLERCWPDVVYVAFSNCDIKGQTASDWHRMGLQSPNLEIEVPYRALLPRGLEGLIVVGKAYSATHDAIAAPRMQPDLENLGGVAAHAAAMAVRAGVAPGGLDVRALQADLVRADLLPESVLSRKLTSLHQDDEGPARPHRHPRRPHAALRLLERGRRHALRGPGADRRRPLRRSARRAAVGGGAGRCRRAEAHAAGAGAGGRRLADGCAGVGRGDRAAARGRRSAGLHA